MLLVGLAREGKERSAQARPAGSQAQIRSPKKIQFQCWGTCMLEVGSHTASSCLPALRSISTHEQLYDPTRVSGITYAMFSLFTAHGTASTAGHTRTQQTHTGSARPCASAQRSMQVAWQHHASSTKSAVHPRMMSVRPPRRACCSGQLPACRCSCAAQQARPHCSTAAPRTTERGDRADQPCAAGGWEQSLSAARQLAAPRRRACTTIGLQNPASQGWGGSSCMLEVNSHVLHENVLPPSFQHSFIVDLYLHMNSCTCTCLK